MAERGRAGGRVAPWPELAARARRAVHWPPWWLGDLLDPLVARLRAWIAAEAGGGRLVPWLPVAFGAGIALYFTAEREPEVLAAVVALIGCAFAGVLLRGRPTGFILAALATAAAAGFAIATLKSARIEHPVLTRPLFGVELAGFVEVREERERTDRIIVAVHRMEARRLEAPLKRVRVSVRKGTAPPVGTFVGMKARLSPPLTPLRPGGYDFARDLYFQHVASFISNGLVDRFREVEDCPFRSCSVQVADGR